MLSRTYGDHPSREEVIIFAYFQSFYFIFSIIKRKEIDILKTLIFIFSEMKLLDS